MAGLLYYSGSSARIAGDYTAVADPANQALTAAVEIQVGRIRQALGLPPTSPGDF